MLTPAEFKKKELVERKKRLYDKEEVDTLLAELTANYEELYTSYEKMAKSAKKLSDGVQYYKSIETTLQKALVLAEKTAKETKDKAEEKAALIEKEANEKAESIVADARKECEQVKEQCMHLVDLFKQYKSQFVEVTSNNLKLLNSKGFDVDVPELEEMYQKQKPDTELGIKKQLENTQDLVAVISSNLANPSSETVVKESAPAPADTITELPVIEPVKAEEQQAEPVTTEGEVQPPKIQYHQTDAAATEEAKTDEKTSETLEVKEVSDTVENMSEPVKEEKSQTLDSLLNDLNMNNKKKDDEDPFEFLGSLDDF